MRIGTSPRSSRCRTLGRLGRSPTDAGGSGRIFVQTRERPIEDSFGDRRGWVRLLCLSFRPSEGLCDREEDLGAVIHQ